MKAIQARILLVVMVCGCLVMSACGTSGSSGGGGGTTTSPSNPTATTAPTATPKPEPTAAPAITTAFCQQIMTVAEANQIMNPPAPATSLVVNASSDSGTCNYVYDTNKVDLMISFETYNGPNPVPQHTITDTIAQLAGLNGVTVLAFSNVSGVGDQAAFVAAQGTYQTITLKVDVFYVLYGKVLLSCDYVLINQTGASDATERSNLETCAKQVVSRM